MVKQAGLFMLVVTTAALTAACSADGSTPGAAGPPSASVSTTSAAEPTAEPAAEPTARPTARPTTEPTGKSTGSDPGDGDMLAGLGTDADWVKFLERCPDSRQKVMIQKVVTGDVNRDGVHDAVVGHACSPVTSYWPSEVDVFDGASSSRKPKRIGGTMLAEVGASDRPYLDGLQVKDGVVVIKAYGVDEDTEPACPSIYRTYRYKYAGGEFKRADREASNANHCPELSN